MAERKSTALTKPAIEGLGERDTLYDSGRGAMPGFGVRRIKDARIFFLRFRVGHGRRARQRWYSIGRFGAPWTVESARNEARRILGEVAGGRDPADKRDADKNAVTVAELCDRYLAAVPTLLTRRRTLKKASTVATDRGRIIRHIKPLLGRLRVDSVTKRDIERFLRDVAEGRTRADVKTGPRGRAIVEGGKGTAARTVGLLGGIFSFAMAEGIRADNPVRGVLRYADRKMERFLDLDDISRLGKALAAAENGAVHGSAIAAIRLLLFTGARKSEILTLKWENIDFALGIARLADSKTGAKLIVLGAPALALLKSLPRVEGCPYVLPGDREGHHYVGLPRAWEKLKAKAGLADFRLHDLRHSFASIAAAGGDGLIMIGKLLGHADAKTTARYTHLAPNPIRAAADRIANTVDTALRS